MPLTFKFHLPKDKDFLEYDSCNSCKLLAMCFRVCKQAWLLQLHRMCLLSHWWEVRRQEVVRMCALDEGRKYVVLWILSL